MSKIDWGSIKIRVVPAGRDHPNEGNPYAKFSSREREAAIVSVSAKIWTRHIRAKLSCGKVIIPNTTKPEPILPHASTPAGAG